MPITRIIQAIFGITLGLLIAASCGKKDTVIVDDKPQSVQCNAQYREASDGMGRMFQFESYYVRCFGPVGVSRAQCIWRQSR